MSRTFRTNKYGEVKTDKSDKIYNDSNNLWDDRYKHKKKASNNEIRQHISGNPYFPCMYCEHNSLKLKDRNIVKSESCHGFGCDWSEDGYADRWER